MAATGYIFKPIFFNLMSKADSPTTARAKCLFLPVLLALLATAGSLRAQIVTTSCTNSYNLCTGDALKLEPNDPTGFTNFKWYANSVAPANLIDAGSAASFFVDGSNPQTDFVAGKIVVTRPVSGSPVAPPSAITYLLTAEYTAAPGGCATLINSIEINFLPVPSLTASPVSICTAAPGSQSADLAALVTDGNNTTGTVTFYPTQADAENQTNALTSSTVSPTATTSYWARKNTTATDLGGAGCFDIVEVVVTVECLSIGNQVFYDTDNSGTKNGAEAGIQNVTVQLFLDADGNGSLAGGEQTPIASTTTASDGTYLFENLKEGKYFVGIPAAELGAAGDLRGLFSSQTSRASDGTVSETTANNADTNNSDIDDNGTAQSSGFYAGGVMSSQVMLMYGSEPTGENPDVDATNPDNDDNQTVDFGFYGMSIGSLVFMDVANDGSFTTGTDMGIAGVTVKLYSADGTALLATTTTGADGRYLFSGLPGGSYITAVDGSSGPLSGKLSSDDIATSTTPNSTDNDDNGTSIIGSEIRSDVFALSPGGAPTGETDQAQTTGPGMGSPAVNDNPSTPDANSDLHVDFGFKSSCPTITNPSANQVVCAEEVGGTAGSDITVSTSLTAAGSVRFVRFASQQTGSAMYTGGTNLAIVTPAAGTATYTFNIADFPNAGATAVTYFVYAVMEPASPDATCRPFQEVQITVNPRPAATNASLAVCENMVGSGSGTFTLPNADADVLGGQTGMTLTYHATFSDAQSGSNPITLPLTAANGTTVYARVESASGCFRTSQVTLNVNAKPGFALSLPPVCPGDNPVVKITLGTGADADPSVAVNGGTAFLYSTLTNGVLTTSNGIILSASNTVTLTNGNGCSNTQSITPPAVTAKVCLPVKVTKL